MDEIEALQAQLTAGAEQRGIRVVPATYADTSVLLIHEATTAEEVLDIIQQSFTPFITIETSYLDRDEVEEKFRDDEDDEVPADVARILDEHDDELARLDVHWVSSGVIFQYAAMPAWRLVLGEALDEHEADSRSHHLDEMRDHWIRVTALAEQLELQPRYRAASTHERATVGKNVFDELRGPDDGIVMEKRVLEEASRRVRANSAEQYDQVDITDQDLVGRLQQTHAWRDAHGAPERDAATRAFLMELTGGYAPKQEMVVSLRRRAALPPHPTRIR